MNIRSNAESIAFYDSSSTERNQMNKEFDLLLSKESCSSCINS